jgi:hypothetical protein
MTKSDRQKRILEHLNRSSELNLISSPKTVKPSTSEITLIPEVKESTSETPLISEITPQPERKKDIMTHLNRSSANFASFSLSSEPRKKQIQNHLRKSLE